MLQIVLLEIPGSGCRQVRAPHPPSRPQARSEGLAEMIGSQSTSSAAGGKVQDEARIYYNYESEAERKKQ